MKRESVAIEDPYMFTLNSLADPETLKACRLVECAICGAPAIYLVAGKVAAPQLEIPLAKLKNQRYAAIIYEVRQIADSTFEMPVCECCSKGMQ